MTNHERIYGGEMTIKPGMNFPGVAEWMEMILLAELWPSEVKAGLKAEHGLPIRLALAQAIAHTELRRRPLAFKFYRVGHSVEMECVEDPGYQPPAVNYQ